MASPRTAEQRRQHRQRRQRRQRRRRERDHRGSVTPMIIGFAVLVVALTAVVVDVSAAFLGRQSLDNLAEGAALQGADRGAEGEEVYRSGVTRQPLEITRARATAAVHTYLSDVGAYRRHEGLRYDVDVRGDEVVVTISADVDLPLAVPGGPDSARVSATGAAITDPE